LTIARIRIVATAWRGRASIFGWCPFDTQKPAATNRFEMVVRNRRHGGESRECPDRLFSKQRASTRGCFMATRRI